MVMKIRREQLGAFARPIGRNRVCRLAAHLRRAFPQRFEAWAEEALQRWAHQAMEAAAKYDIEEEYDFCRFADLTTLLGPGFADSGGFEWAGRLLSDRSIPASRRLDEVVERIRRELGVSAAGSGGTKGPGSADGTKEHDR